jgi:UDP-MurNAc hydroxylase
MWYPNCYNYTPTEMADRVGKVRANLIDTLARICAACDAQAYLPSAGPPCFLDPALEAYNHRATTIFHGWDDIAEEFLDRCHDIEIVRANPGDRISARASGGYIVEHAALVQDSLTCYRERRRDEWDIHRSAAVPVTVDQLTAYLSSLGRKNRHLLAGYSKRIRISTADQSWDITLGPDDALTVVSSTPEFCAEYAFEIPPWVLRRIVNRQTTWEDALLSMRIRLARDPDRFDARLLGLLRYGQQPIQTKQMLVDSLGSEELIPQGGGLCQRYCPHAGEDLTFAKVSGRTLECPRHHWKWDLDSGMCLEGGDLPLVVRPRSLSAAQPA